MAGLRAHDDKAQDAEGRLDAASENTPLLAAEDPRSTPNGAVNGAANGAGPETREDEEGKKGEDDEKGLPRAQIAFLCYARFIEPVVFFSIFPYISQMVKENGGLADSDVGFYSGLVESLFSLTQMLVMILWGKAADRLGRKPVLVSSLFGISLTTSWFGMAKTIWQMILFRCLAGVFAGTVVTIRTMIAEHSTSKTQARAFSWFAFTGNLGIFLGPLIGGALADPAGQYPSLFGGSAFFREYPYALPSFAIGLISLGSAVVCALFIEETLPKKRRQAVPAVPVAGTSTESHISDEAVSFPAPPLSTMKLLRSPGVAMALYSYGHVMLLAFAYTAVTPVFWFTPVVLGGFGLTTLQISLMMGLNGLAQAVWILLAFPPLQHRIGTAGVLRICGAVYPFYYAISPLFNMLLRAGGDSADGSATRTAFWALAPALLAIGSGVSMSFTAIQLAINDVAPNPEVRGTLNAVALTEVSGIRAFAPAIFTSLFAVGARTQWLGGYFVWVIMVALAVSWTLVTRRLPDFDQIRKTTERAQL